MASNWYKMYIAILMLGATLHTNYAESQVEGHSNDGNAEPRALFHPRVDYNEWMPVGRGDPLKNDPTYDYSPPVLDRVHYWGNLNKSKDKKEILLLGVTSKRSHKKEPKHNAIMRRNFHSHLPTRLMPPPMQTISPVTKHSSTENYHASYYRNHYNVPNHSWSHNSINYPDSNVEESISYHSVSRPNKNTIRHDYASQQPSSSRKPWLHALLEKEVTKPAPPYLMQPSQSIFESHPPPSLEAVPTISSTIPSTIPTSTKSYFMTTSEIPYFQPTIPPVVATTTTEPTLSHIDQTPSFIPRPMYMIIEGHSKVKTYGQNDSAAGSEHAPKIVPIQPDEEAIIKHVVSEDEHGHAMQVMHLHKTPEPSTTPTTDVPPSGMGDLLSLLDESFGNFFLGEESKTKPKSSEKFEQPKLIKNEMIERIEKQEATNKSVDPQSIKTANITETSSKLDNIEISDRIDRETRQIFDYDDLPEPSLREENYSGFPIFLLPKSAQGAIYESDVDYSSSEIV